MLTLPRLTYVKPSKFTAMAIIENMWLRKSKKRLGGVVLYQAMEQTRARELASSVANPRTASQMGQRVKWSQLVNFYRANGSWMKYAYETKTPQQSEYNKFMQLNVANSNVYFTKQQAAAGSCVVLPYIMTQGSLPSIEFTAESGSWPSNIYYPAGSAIVETTTVAEFSGLLISQNPAIREGDQLSFIRFTQMFNSDTGNPYVIIRKYEIVVNSLSDELVGSYLPLDYIGVVSIGTTPQIAVIDSGNAGGFLMCLSRTVGGKTYVSSQSIITTRMDATISQLSSATQLAEAVASYGENADAFLSSTSASINSNAITPLTITGVVAANNTYFLPSMQVMMEPNFEANDAVRVVFNGNLGSSVPQVVSFYTSKKKVDLQSPYVDGTSISGNMPAAAEFDEDEYLVSIAARFADGFYTVQFRRYF